MSDRMAELIREMEEEVQDLRDLHADLSDELSQVYYELQALRQWMDELGIPTPDKMSVGEELDIRQRLEARS